MKIKPYLKDVIDKMLVPYKDDETLTALPNTKNVRAFIKNYPL